MNEDFKKRLLELGLTEEQVLKLEAEGVTEASDIQLLSKEEIMTVTGLKLIPATKLYNAFVAPTVVPAVVEKPAEHVETVAADAEIPDGKAPSTAHVNSFASSLSNNFFS